MSQPVLVLSNPAHPDIDADDVSDQSTSPDLSTYHAPLQNHIIGHARKVSSQSMYSNSPAFPIRDSLLKKQSNNVNVHSNPAVLPAIIDISRPSIPNSLKPGGLIKRPLSNSTDLAFEEGRPSFERSPRISTRPLPLLPANSDDTVGPNVTSTLKSNMDTGPQGRILYGSTPTLIGRSDIAEKAPADSSPQVSSPGPHHLPKRERVGPKLTLNTTMDINIDENNSGNSSSSPSVPRRTVSSGPRQRLPPANYRFSLNLVDGYSARMSPSVIRPPPLPLLNLPVLPETTTSTTLDASSRRSKRAGLMSMPALPRHGSSRGTNGLEELDDVEDEDEEDDGVDDDGGSDHTLLEDELDTPRSDGSTTQTISSPRSRTPSTSSYETVHESSPSPDQEDCSDLVRPPERKLSFLPPVDMSRIDLSFLDLPPSDNIDKGKAKELTEDAGRTPIATTRSNKRNGTSNPTAFRGMDYETKMDAWAASPVITKASSPMQTPRPGGHFNFPPPMTKGDQPRSPTQTPRPGGHFNLPLSALPPPSPRSPLTRSTTVNRVSVLSMNSISQFPRTYNLASQSLIDVNAMEKKEKVEQMVREEEENAEEERKKRVKAKRMSMRVSVADASAITVSQLDGQLKTSAPIRMDDEDPVKASSSFSSPTAKQPKSTINRISMAPAYETIIPLRRRLSMPTFNAMSTPPPPYPDLFPNSQVYGVKPTQIQPRDDEGREKLPAYSNSIYIKAIMPRKVEFTRPGVQSKDRKWKRVLCVLEGTSFKVYKPPGVSVIGGWWENQVGVGDIAVPTTTTTSFNSKGGIQTAQAVKRSKEEVEREREMMGYMTTTHPSQIDNANQRRGSMPSISGNSHTSTIRSPVSPPTKSALNAAVHLFIPSSRGHSRTISDIGQSSNTPSVPQMPRPSLNIPMNGRSTSASSFSSSRSPSPMFTTSSSSLLTTPSGSSCSNHTMHLTPSSTGSATSRMDTTNFSISSKGKKKAEDSDFVPDKRSLIKAYTMQKAESGLGNDYVKRKHVIRVRLEGEQFLLQATDVDSVIRWIEVRVFFFSLAMFLV